MSMERCDCECCCAIGWGPVCEPPKIKQHPHLRHTQNRGWTHAGTPMPAPWGTCHSNKVEDIHQEVPAGDDDPPPPSSAVGISPRSEAFALTHLTILEPPPHVPRTQTFSAESISRRQFLLSSRRNGIRSLPPSPLRSTPLAVGSLPLNHLSLHALAGCGGGSAEQQQQQTTLSRGWLRASYSGSGTIQSSPSSSLRRATPKYRSLTVPKDGEEGHNGSSGGGSPQQQSASRVLRIRSAAAGAAAGLLLPPMFIAPPPPPLLLHLPGATH
jgi:hypothetical protein